MKNRLLIPLSFLFVFIYSFSALAFNISDRWVLLPQSAPGILTQGDEEDGGLSIKGYENYYLDNVVWTSSDENILEILDTTDETFKILAKNPGGAHITVDFDFYYYDDEDAATPSNATTSSADEIMLMKHYNLKTSFVVTGVEGDFRFLELGNNIIIYRYIGNGQQVIIPEYIKGKPVTQIDRYAIYNNNNIKQITIPKTVTYLYGDCNCPYLTKVINNSFSDIDLSNFHETLDEGVNRTWYTKETGGFLLDKVLPANSTMYRQFPINYHLEGASQQEIDALVSRSGNPVRYSTLRDTALYKLPNNNGAKFSRWELKLEDSTFQTIASVNKNTWGSIDLYAIYEGSVYNNSSDSSSGSSTAAKGLQSYAAITNSGEIIPAGSYQGTGEWKRDSAGWTYLDAEQCIVTNKWISDQGKWYLVNQNGKMVTGWQMVDNKWYLFATDGSMLAGWQYVNNKWYFMKPDGTMVTGWLLVNGKYYYLDISGMLLTNTTTPDGYQVNADGVWV